MQSLYVTLPGISPDASWVQPLKGGNPIEVDLKSEAWSVVRINIGESPIKVYSKFEPKRDYPRKRLFRASKKKLVIGMGQKVLIPAKPATGKTTLCRMIVDTIRKTKKAKVTPILIDERPEESLGRGSVNLSYMRSPDDIINSFMSAVGEVVARVHTKGSDEVIVIDSLTRLVQVANSALLKNNPELATGQGGVTLESRKFVRQIFGLGNNLGRGSLTVVATCLVGGSTLEDIIYSDLKGVSTSEIFISKDENGKPIIDPRKSYVRDMHLIK